MCVRVCVCMSICWDVVLRISERLEQQDYVEMLHQSLVPVNYFDLLFRLECGWGDWVLSDLMSSYIYIENIFWL